MAVEQPVKSHSWSNSLKMAHYDNGAPSSRMQVYTLNERSFVTFPIEIIDGPEKNGPTCLLIMTSSDPVGSLSYLFLQFCTLQVQKSWFLKWEKFLPQDTARIPLNYIKIIVLIITITTYIQNRFLEHLLYIVCRTLSFDHTWPTISKTDQCRDIKDQLSQLNLA